MSRFLCVSIRKGFDKRRSILLGCTTTMLLLLIHQYNNDQSNLTPCYNPVGDQVNDNVQNVTYFGTTLYPPGVILQKKGGIGNQLFQYACSYALAKDLGWPLYVYLTGNQQNRIFQPHKREFVLDKFQINLNAIDQTTNLSAKINHLNDRTLFEKKFEAPSPNKFLAISETSYCQSKEYWTNYQNEIQAMFQPKPEAINSNKLEKIINRIKNSEESVAVHVRRGDFLNAKQLIIPISYQRYAIKKIISMLKRRGKKKPVFYIFSDDIAHAEKELKDLADLYELVFVPKEIPGSTSIEDFYLMTLCRHIIIPNSTYSWWAAYLIKNKDKIVIASAHNPLYFQLFTENSIFYKKLFGTMYYPKEWIVIDPFTDGFSQESSK